MGKVPSCEYLGSEDLPWGRGHGNCFRHYHHVKHQWKGEGDLVTDLLWQSSGRLLTAAKLLLFLASPNISKT